MKARTRWKIAIVSTAIAAAVVLVLAALVHYGVIAETHQICERDSDTHKESCSSYLLGSFVGKSVWMLLNEGSAAIGALATIVIAWFTATLWFATRGLHHASGDQSKAMSDSAAAMDRIGRALSFQSRAYLSISLDGAVYQDATKKFEAVLKVTNTGFTAATNVRWKIAAAILPVPLPADFKYPLPRNAMGGLTVGAQQMGVMSAVVEHRVDEEAVAAIKLGMNQALYAWGTVSYKDVFRRTRRCTFAHHIYWMQVGRINEDGSTPEIVRTYYLARHNRAN